VNADHPRENIFGKMRGRYDEVMARRVVKTLAEETLDRLWALSDDDLADMVSRHNTRNLNGRGSHRLVMTMRETP
jgi:hypothetical protein